jgi:hypothetical protein
LLAHGTPWFYAFPHLKCVCVCIICVVARPALAQGCTGPNPAHVALQASTILSVCWTPFLDAGNVGIAGCTLQVLSVSATDTAVAVSPVAVDCAALTATLTPSPPLAPGTYAVQVSATTSAGGVFSATSPVLRVAGPVVVAPSAAPLDLPAQASPDVCAEFVVDGAAGDPGPLSHTLLAGSSPCGTDLPLTGATVRGPGDGEDQAAQALTACGSVASASLVYLSLRTCDALGRCTIACGPAVMVDVDAPRVDAGLVWQPTAGPAQSVDPFVCAWSGVVDDGCGVAEYAVCFSTLPLAQCDLSAVVTVPASAAPLVTIDWVATYSTPERSRVAAALAAAGSVYCVVTARDRVGNTAVLASASRPVLDAAPLPLSVEVAVAGAAPGLPPAPLTLWRHAQGAGVAWAFDEDDIPFVAVVRVGLRCLSSGGAPTALVAREVAAVPVESGFTAWNAVSLASCASIQAYVVVVSASGVESDPVLSAPVPLEAQPAEDPSSGGGASPQLLPFTATVPVQLQCPTDRRFPALSTVSVGLSDSANGAGIGAALPCGDAATVTATTFVGTQLPRWGAVAAVASTETSATGLSVARGRPLALVALDPLKCWGNSAAFQSRVVSEDGSFIVSFTLPASLFPLLSPVADLLLGTLPGATNLAPTASRDVYAASVAVSVPTAGLTAPAGALCVPVYACLRVSPLLGDSAACDVCTVEPGWLQRAPLDASSARLLVLPGSAASAVVSTLAATGELADDAGAVTRNDTSTGVGARLTFPELTLVWDEFSGGCPGDPAPVYTVHLIVPYVQGLRPLPPSATTSLRRLLRGSRGVYVAVVDVASVQLCSPFTLAVVGTDAQGGSAFVTSVVVDPSCACVVSGVASPARPTACPDPSCVRVSPMCRHRQHSQRDC